jgi:hypothetical protein
VGRSHRRPGPGGPGGGCLAAARRAGPLSGRGSGGMGVFAGGGTTRAAAGLRDGIEGLGGTGSHRRAWGHKGPLLAGPGPIAKAPDLRLCRD